MRRSILFPNGLSYYAAMCVPRPVSMWNVLGAGGSAAIIILFRIPLYCTLRKPFYGKEKTVSHKPPQGRRKFEKICPEIIPKIIYSQTSQ